jgi:hypothetical protein
LTWHVLLLGCATDGLTGVGRDLLRMRTLIDHARRNDVSLVEHPAATREHIVESFEALCAAVRPGDDVLVYYTGHGLRLRDPETRQPAYAIAPVGADEAPPGVFGYVLQEELSAWFWRITQVTRNVTWIADCCYAGGVMRGVRVARGLEERRRSFATTRRRLLAELPPEALDPDGNPHVLRASASANDRKAFEDGADGGLFTKALTEALDELQHRPIVCDDLARLVIRKLTRERQLPAFAGPVQRFWLTALEAPPRAFPTAVLHTRGTLLAGGRLLDHRVGDRYVVKAADGATASLVITRVLAHRSECEPDGQVSLTVGATATLRHAGEPRATVEFPLDTPASDLLVTAVTASGYLARAGTATAPLVGRILVEDGHRLIATPSGQRVDAGPVTDPPDRARQLLDGLARQSALLALPCSDAALLASRYTLEPLPDRTAVELTNLSALKIYVSALELLPDGPIELVTRAQPDGEAIAPQRSLVIRPLHHDQRTSPRRLVFVVTDTRIDLRAWTSEPPAAPEILRGGGDAPWFGVHAVELASPAPASASDALTR